MSILLGKEVCVCVREGRNRLGVLGCWGKRGLSTGRAQRMAGARRAPQAWGRFSAKESRVSERVRVCLGVYVRGSGSECRAVQGRFHGWLITGVRASTLATAARPCRHCPLPPQPTHTPPPSILCTMGASLDRHSPAQHCSAWQAALAANDGNCVRYAWRERKGGAVMLMEQVSGKRSSPYSPHASPARGSRFLWDYFSFFSLFALPIGFISIIFSSFSHLLSKALSQSAYPRAISAPMRACPVYNTGTPWPLPTGSFREAELGQSSWRTDWHRTRFCLLCLINDKWYKRMTGWWRWE